jgi:hypothetical protein
MYLATILALALSPTVSPPSVATSAAGIHISTPLIRGNGCAGNSGTAVFGADGRTLEVTYADPFFLGVEAGEGRAIKSCNVAIPLQLPEGRRLVIDGATMPVRFAIPSSGRAEVAREYFFAGQRGTSLAPLTLPSGARGEIYLDDDVDGPASACGGGAILRMNMSFRVDRPDSLDVRLSTGFTKLVLRVHVEPCI